MISQRIGLDFDNTIVSYDEVFLASAKEFGLIGHDVRLTGKQAVRDLIRLSPDGELKWQRLQGHVYGKRIGGAVMFDGVVEFIRRCRSAGHNVVIVSHKTEFGHGDPDRINLRDKAVEWMARNDILQEECGVRREDVFFETTRIEKLRRIGQLECTVFIDDLREVLDDPEFPKDVERVLFSPDQLHRCSAEYPVCATWTQIGSRVFDR